MTIHTDIDKVFNKGLDGYSKTPPTFIWENINNKLNDKKRSKKRTFYLAAAASIALIFSFGAGYLSMHQKTENIAVITTALPNNDNTTPQKTNASAIVQSENNTANDSNKEKTNEQPIIKEKPINTNKTKEEPVPSKVKKVNSAGTLLPPMFATSSTFKANNTLPVYTNQTEESRINNYNLNYMKLRFPLLDVPENEKELIYKTR